MKKKSEYFKIFKKNELNKLWIKILKKYSEKHNLLFFVSVFNSNKINFLKKNNIDAYKVAASELSNFDLLHKKLEDLVDIGIYECEKYYPSFHQVLFDEISAEKALKFSNFEIIGRA